MFSGNGLNTWGSRVDFQTLLKPWLVNVDDHMGNDSELFLFEYVPLNIFLPGKETERLLIPDWY